MESVFVKAIQKMQQEGLSEAVIENFIAYANQISDPNAAMIGEQAISPVSPSKIISQPRAKNPEPQAVQGVAAIKLNGGLGTSMGLNTPKILLPAHSEKSFLQLIVQQIMHLQQATESQIPLVFMNSFSSHQPTIDALEKINHNVDILHFVQNKFPRLSATSLQPITHSSPQQEWNPPGHGDLFSALFDSGTFDILKSKGVKFLFVSNCDNLGASVDEAIATYIQQNNIDFLMEVAQRTPADSKGGHLAMYKDSGRLLLRERAQAWERELTYFEDINRYNYFNTNNLWISMEALEKIHSEKKLHLPLIINRKQLQTAADKKEDIIQLESAMGAAIELFENAAAMLVEPSRFLPVKKCSDLMNVTSDRYEQQQDGSLRLSAEAAAERITISLDPQHYGTLAQYIELIGKHPPSLLHCKSLQIRGAVACDPDVTFSGDVSISAPTGTTATLAPGHYTGSVTL